MRAREPDSSGFIERDGVVLHYEVSGDGKPTVMMLPTWSIVHSGVWKAQIPFLARHFRVVTFDGRGCGRSGRPAGAGAYLHEQFADDALAVLDGTGTDTAVLVALSSGARWGIHLAAEHSERVLGVVSIGSNTPLVPDHLGRPPAPSWVKPDSPYWEQDFSGFIEFFMERMFTEPHSTKPIEDAIEWGLDIGPITLSDTYRGIHLTDPQWFRMACNRLCCPVLVIHGDEDAIRPHASGAALAEATNGQLVTIAGGGHAPNLRDPVVVNRLIREFVESVALPDMAGYR